MLSSQEIGFSLVSFEMIFEAPSFQININLGSKILKFPEINLIMGRSALTEPLGGENFTVKSLEIL